MPSKCCMPLCNGNYDTGPKVHVFKFPDNEDLKKKWIRAVNRKEFIPSKYSRVCHLHFEPDAIIWSSSMVDPRTGILITAPNLVPKLAEGAIPKILPNCASFLSLAEMNLVKLNKKVADDPIVHQRTSRERKRDLIVTKESSQDRKKDLIVLQKSSQGGKKDPVITQESSQDRKRQISSYSAVFYKSIIRKPDASKSLEMVFDARELVYNDKGILTINGKDLCDCLDTECPGCFFPCRHCLSNKCGNTCRKKRQYSYESEEITGTDVVVINPYILNYVKNK